MKCAPGNRDDAPYAFDRRSEGLGLCQCRIALIDEFDARDPGAGGRLDGCTGRVGGTDGRIHSHGAQRRGKQEISTIEHP